MKYKVKHEFRDINDFSIAHKEGNIVELNEERAARLVGFGLVETYTEKVKPSAKPKSAKSKEA